MSEPAQPLAQISEQRAWCEQMVADLTIVRADLDDDPADQWHHVRMVADWGLDYYSAELHALDRPASGLIETACVTRR